MSAALHSPPIKTVVPGDEHLCWGSCTHIACLNIRAQLRLPCIACGDVCASGSRVYILERGDFGVPTKQIHAACYENRP